MRRAWKVVSTARARLRHNYRLSKLLGHDVGGDGCSLRRLIDDDIEFPVGAVKRHLVGSPPRLWPTVIRVSDPTLF